MPLQVIRIVLVYVFAPLMLILMLSFAAAYVLGAQGPLYAGPILGPVLLFVIAQAWRRYLRRTDVAALGYLELAARTNLPLPRLLLAGAVAESSRLARRLRAMHDDLSVGLPVSDTVADRLESLPARDAAMLRAAEHAGCLPSRLRTLLEQEQRVIRRQNAEEPVAMIYPLIVLICLIGLLGGMLVFIAPRFQRIFEDFETDLPAITLLVFDHGLSIGTPLLGLASLALVIVCGWSFWQLLNPEERVGWLRESARAVAWRLPVLHGMERDRGLTDVFDAMADSLAAGLPAPDAIDRAAELDLNPVLRARLRDWHRRVAAGASLSEAARAASLPSICVGMLATAEATGRADEVCRFLARYYAGKFSRIATIIRHSVMPLAVIALAVLVGGFVVAIMLPLVSLIEAVNVSVF